MSRYDASLTTFAPDGHLFQVDYALEAVKKGTACVGVKGKDCVIVGVERKTVLQLQDPRTVRKTAMLDEHIVLGFAGLTADARILIDRARVECASHRLTAEDPVTVEYIARHRYTQSGGVRPFGISTLIAGFDHDDPHPRLYLTEPSGIFSSWKANAVGRSSKTIREYLEKNYVADASEEQTIALAVKALLEVVQAGAKNIELSVISGYGAVRNLTAEELDAVVAKIEEEKKEEAEKKKSRLAAAASSREAIFTGEGATGATAEEEAGAGEA
ncbi:Proteasome subunit alpha type-4 [Rhodosporidiobolus nylandii]